MRSNGLPDDFALRQARLTSFTVQGVGELLIEPNGQRVAHDLRSVTQWWHRCATHSVRAIVEGILDQGVPHDLAPTGRHGYSDGVQISSPTEPRSGLDGTCQQRDARGYPAQQDNALTSFLNVCAASFSPSTIVRYGNN